MLILGVETTCDETSVALVRDGRHIIKNLTASSALMHTKYGGVVPEVAARDQVRVIVPLLDELLGRDFSHVDCVAVASGPGLIGSLLVGVETAKALAYIWEKPLIAVNHLIGHIYANWLEPSAPEFPLTALIVSGGHTDLILMRDEKSFDWLGGTRDDAAGEAFDKVARVLGLGYPGGPEIEKLASSYQRLASSGKKQVFPRPMIGSGNFDFSFSGLKTFVANLVHSSQFNRESIAYEFQEAIVDVLVKKTAIAAKKFGAKSVVVGGGVSANSRLRKQMASTVMGAKIYFPDKKLSIIPPKRPDGFIPMS